MEIHRALSQEMIKDYYTANIKSEVMLDAILTPVIANILTVIGQENKRINGEVRLLAKEFPLLSNKNAEGGKPNFRSCNADYLMCDTDSVFLVELKARQESYHHAQMENYLAYCLNRERFSESAGKNFVYLLNHVSKTGYSHKTWAEKIGALKAKDALKWLFEIIVNYPEDRGKTAYPEAGWEGKGKRDGSHAERAIQYLKEEKAASSKKYLFTAGQMLDNMKESEFWEKRIGLLYLMPEMPAKTQIQPECIVTFKEILEQADAICRKLEQTGLTEYWKWVVELLELLYK